MMMEDDEHVFAMTVENKEEMLIELTPPRVPPNLGVF